LKPGRFSDLKTLLELGDQPSLHMPKAVDGKRMFIETESEDQSTKSYDFIAHSDSAYAFLPLGTFLHLFIVVIGAKNRRPCPVEHGLREILLRE
jgi:hypothetical protein